MNVLPNDIVRYIGDELLNPCDRSRFSTCSSHFRNILPTALRVKIISSRGDSSLQTEFFVSPVEHPTMYIQATENLVFGQQYFFWTFDYTRGNKVFLGRHTRHGGGEADEHGDYPSIYSLGLRPCHPNQCWEIAGGDYGDVVMWGEDIVLSVSGRNTSKPRDPDSCQCSTLSCLTIPRCNQPMWCALDKHPCAAESSEKMQLLRCQEFVPGEDVSEKELNVYAIPEVCDEGEYLLLNPKDLKDGLVGCEGYHVTVDFHFWVEDGIMHFHAADLPFLLGIPILESDNYYDAAVASNNKNNNKKSPLAHLLEINSARWGCFVYYMAAAADIGANSLEADVSRFMRRVTDHRDHTVVFDEKKGLVLVKVRTKKTDTRINTPIHDRNAWWHFILSC